MWKSWSANGVLRICSWTHSDSQAPGRPMLTHHEVAEAGWGFKAWGKAAGAVAWSLSESVSPSGWQRGAWWQGPARRTPCAGRSQAFLLSGPSSGSVDGLVALGSSRGLAWSVQTCLCPGITSIPRNDLSQLPFPWNTDFLTGRSPQSGAHRTALPGPGTGSPHAAPHQAALGGRWASVSQGLPSTSLKRGPRFRPAFSLSF